MFELPLVQVFFLFHLVLHLDNIILHFYINVNTFFINISIFLVFLLERQSCYLLLCPALCI
nr:MAG TPA: hypothetical protein [Caudoviricetes sp.]